MLVLTRKQRETIYIGDDIKLSINWIKGSQVSIAIEAPKGVLIVRGELRKETHADLDIPGATEER